MLGPRSHRTPETRRRDRRRIVIAVVVLIVVAIVLGEVINDLVKSSPAAARRTEATWSAAVAAIIAESNTLSPSIHDIRAHATDAASYDRVTLEFALSDLERTSAQESQAFESLGLAAPSATMATLASEVISWRADGLKKLSRGVALALTPGGDLSAGTTLASAGSELVAADSAYRHLVRLVTRRGVDAGLPSSSWISDPSQWSATSAAVWARALAAAPKLAASAGIEIVAMTLEPPPLRITGEPSPTLPSLPATTTTSTTSTTTTTTAGSSTTLAHRTTTTTSTSTLPGPTTTSQIPPLGSISIIAPTSHVRVVVIVENTGNVAIRGAHVVALIESALRGSAGRASVEAKVPTLVPGASAYLVLPKLAVARAATYDLLVTASLANGRSVRRSVKLEVGG